MKKRTGRPQAVALLNPATCGIYKSGGTRFKVDHETGRRLAEVDDELAEHVASFVAGREPPGLVRVATKDAFEKRILVPRYYDQRYMAPFEELLEAHGLQSISLGQLSDAHAIDVGSGHASPSNDMRAGDIPYIKVSDVRSLRVNVNPTNLVSRAVAEACWGGTESGLQGWDLLTPNRASSNIGEFALLLPGEEERVLTKEFFVIRVGEEAPAGWDWAYLMWALCLHAVRRQWQRVTLMQTNREDVGERWREILLPAPLDADWARNVSKPFRDYFGAVARARQSFLDGIQGSGFEYIASVASDVPEVAEESGHE
jgi:type I restriction enzyme M protein